MNVLDACLCFAKSLSVKWVLSLPRGVLILAVLGWLATQCVAGESIARYNVLWESPSKDATGQMPLGNGDIAAGVYAIEDGDLYLLLAKNDALTYNGDIFKTGRVRVSIAPNPFVSGKPFRQTLDLSTGSIRIEADGISSVSGRMPCVRFIMCRSTRPKR